MIFTFYKIEENEESGAQKKFLQSYVCDHQIWKNLDFWKSSIYTAIVDEFENQKSYYYNENESEFEKQTRVKNLVFGQLAAIGQNMYMFGMEKKVVFEIMGKFFEYYDLEEGQMENLKVLI